MMMTMSRYISHTHTQRHTPSSVQRVRMKRMKREEKMVELSFSNVLTIVRYLLVAFVIIIVLFFFWDSHRHGHEQPLSKL